MANYVGFEGANTVMLAPEGASDVSDLPVFKGDVEVISCWRLTDAEITQISKTGVVWLSIKGNGMPPVLIAASGVLSFDGREPAAEPFIKPAKRKASQ